MGLGIKPSHQSDKIITFNEEDERSSDNKPHSNSSYENFLDGPNKSKNKDSSASSARNYDYTD